MNFEYYDKTRSIASLMTEYKISNKFLNVLKQLFSFDVFARRWGYFLDSLAEISQKNEIGKIPFVL